MQAKKPHWALDDSDKDQIIRKLQGKRKNINIDIQRFKGLGEMMPATLRETTLDPDKRRLLQVSIADTDKLTTETVISELMGKDASARYSFIMEHATEVEDLDV